VRQVLPDHILQGAFAEEDELLHTFRFDGLHEPLRKRIQVTSGAALDCWW
jgi:hypothetical protein